MTDRIFRYIRLGIYPILILIIISFILLYFFYKSKPEIFLIPKNYNGEIIVVFDQSKGIPEKYVNGKRVYEIPANGILITQFDWNPGFNNREFYYLSNSDKIKIEEVKVDYEFHTGDPDSELVNVIDKRPFYYKNDIGDKYLFRAYQFIISQRSHFNSYNIEVKMDSVINAEFR